VFQQKNAVLVILSRLKSGMIKSGLPGYREIKQPRSNGLA
jgi:hypothetical protein